jgi:hypothetical protein
MVVRRHHWIRRSHHPFSNRRIAIMVIMGIHFDHLDLIALIVALGCLSQQILDDRYRKKYGMSRA